MRLVFFLEGGEGAGGYPIPRLHYSPGPPEAPPFNVIPTLQGKDIDRV